MAVQNKIDAWEELKKKLVSDEESVYEEVLEQYWSSLNAFYAFFGVNDFGQAKVSDLGPDPTSEELKNWTSANGLAYKLNFLKKEVFEKVRAAEEGGFLQSDKEFSLEEGNWPQAADLQNDVFHDQVLAPLVNQLVQDFKVILGNSLVSQPDDEYFDFGTQPSEAAFEILSDAIEKASKYLSLFPGQSLTLKKDIQPLEESKGKGPTPIFSDINLEKSLSFTKGFRHYIGVLLDPQMTGRSASKRYSNPYLPVRYAPHYDPNAATWNDENYSLVEIFGAQLKQVKTYGKQKDFRGIEVPLGLEIQITEIVESETGIWVGFISDQISSIATKSNKRVLYTRAEFIRVKEEYISSFPDPYLSRKILTTNPNLTQEEVGTIPGAELIDPKSNENWILLNPLDVRLKRYDFIKHNEELSEDDLVFSAETMSNNTSLRYSDGDYYFIRGEIPRKSEEEILQDSETDISGDEKEIEEKKKQISSATINILKQEAWKNLLNYLDKHHNLSGDPIQQELFNKYFIIAAAKVNTASVNPNNQKMLFAIRASYVDALPESNKLYIENFSTEEDTFQGGRNFTTSFKLKEFKKALEEIKSKFNSIKSKISTSNTKIQNPNNIDYDIVTQINVLDELPGIFNRFFARQALPANTNADMLSTLAAEGLETADDHIIQIGIRDNGAVGANVRETISYILFSPDPKTIRNDKGDASAGLPGGLFYFDPFLKDTEVKGTDAIPRSAIPLRIGMQLFREEFQGIYGSRALHLLFSYNGFRSKLKDETYEDQWIEFLQNYSVPPLKIFPSLDPTKVADSESVDCDEIIRRLNNSGPITGAEERRLQEILTTRCVGQHSAKYWSQFKDGTPATDPSFSKEALKKISEDSKNKNSSGALQNEYIRVLYTSFFNAIDPQSLVSLIMACIQKKLGIPLSAEAICEAAIVELVKNLGVNQVEQIIIANALLAPGREISINALNALGAGPGKKSGATLVAEGVSADLNDYADENGNQITVTDLDYTWNDAPLATALVVAGTSETAATIEIIKNLEKSGAYVKLVPGRRKLGASEVAIPYGPTKLLNKLVPDIYLKNGEPYVLVQEFYTQEEIEDETDRLMKQGYSRAEAEAELVVIGMLTPSQEYYDAVATGEVVTAPLKDLANKLGGETGASIMASTRDAENWLGYMKNAVSLGGLCELIVGDILEGLEDLIRNPGAFSFSNWGSNFLDRLKRRFSPPAPTMKFPDSLITDNHMGDYSKRLYKMLLSMVAGILGQIVELLIRQALEACLEESPGLGPEPPNGSVTPPIALPDIQRANIPEVGTLPRSDVAAWIKDIMDNLSVQQLCALLRGDASQQTLYDCLVRTRENWPNVYNNGMDSMLDIVVTFKMISEDINFEICNLIQSINPVEDLCDAVFDHDSRCASLKLAGLTDEECADQIKSELNDLKSKISGMVPLLFEETNPLSSIPSICEVEGAFQVPDGVEDSMNRVTDNILDHVKGSLIQDMSVLKFFATPPRAVLALTDREELDKAHSIFINLDITPNTTLCVVPILPEIEFHNAPSPPIKSLTNRVYPLVYNGSIHYGGHSTLRNYNDVGLNKSGKRKWVNTLPTEGEETQNPFGAIVATATDPAEIFDGTQNVMGTDIHLPGLMSTPWEGYGNAFGQNGQYEGMNEFNKGYGSPEDSTMNFAAKNGYVNLKWETEELLGKYYGPTGGDAEIILAGKKSYNLSSTILPKNVTEANRFLPTTVFSLFSKKMHPGMEEEATIIDGWGNTTGDSYTGDRVAEIVNALRAFLMQEGIVDAVTMTSLSSMEVMQYAGENLFELNEKLVEILEAEGPKPTYAGTLIVTPEDVIRLNSGTGAASIVGPQTHRSKYEIQPSPISDGFSGDFSMAPGHQAMNQVWSLDTKLRDIRNEAMSWYPMVQLFTGLHILHWNDLDSPINPGTWTASEAASSSDTDEHSNNYHAWPGQILKFNDAHLKESLGGGFSKVDPEAELLGAFNKSTRNSITNPGSRVWLPWLGLSPGLLKLYRICQQTRYIDQQGPYKKAYYDKGGVWPTVRPGYKPWAKYNHECDDKPPFYSSECPESHTIVDAFMELTVGEALGLTESRMKQIMPNLKTSIKGVIFGEGVTESTLIGSAEYETSFNNLDGTYSPQPNIKSPQNLAAGMLPLYVVYEETSLQGDSMAMEDMLDHFTMDNDHVNKKLYEALSNSEHFVSSIGLEKNGLIQENQDFYRLDTVSLFNPNTLLYPLPFSETVNKNVDGQFNGAQTTQEILDIFKEGFQDSGLEQATNLLEQMESVNKNNKILYQNTLINTVDNVTKQIDQIKDVLTVAKGKIKETNDMPPIPADVLKSESQIYKSQFILKQEKTYDDDIVDLLKDVYAGEFNYQKLKNIYSNDFEKISQDVIDNNIDLLPKVHHAAPSSLGLSAQSYYNSLVAGKGPYKLDPFNFKAQIFGEFLTHKFMKAYEKYYHMDPSYDNVPFPITKEEFSRRLKYILATYGYSALQYGYSTQAFTKLRGSRLQSRKFMKALWKKILKSPLSSDSSVKAECQDVLDQMSLIGKSDIDKTETDFFNLNSVKPQIKEIYMRSLCADVYEKEPDTKQFPGTESLGAAQISLLEGSVILLVKAYVLEVCLASVIAWESFDILEILEDELIVEIVRENIVKDEYDIEMISYFCNDIIRKRENMTDVEKYKFITSRMSALKYIVNEEAKFISSTIKEIFTNKNHYNPLTTDLTLNILKNSDSDFVAQYPSVTPLTGIEEQLVQAAPVGYASLYDSTKEDYVASVSMPNNIYTMNYGEGKKVDFHPIYGPSNTIEDLRPLHSDIFGYFSKFGNYNKNLFHSLPMNQYTGHGQYPDDNWITNLPGGSQVADGPIDVNEYAEQLDSFYNQDDHTSTPGRLSRFLTDTLPVHEDLLNADAEIITGEGKANKGCPRIKMAADPQFKKYTELQRLSLGGADPWHKENFQEILFGSMANGKLGNITINPYVRIEIETNCEKYNFDEPITNPTEPCDDPETQKIDACNDDFQAQIAAMHAYMEENIFNCHIDGYVPLSVWSYFYNNFFLEMINATDLPAAKLYSKFGLKPFFKEVSFGLRLSYITSFPIFHAKDLKFTEFMQASFPYGKESFDEPYGLNGLKKVKSLFSVRPYQVPSDKYDDADQLIPSYKLARELHIPIVEVEREIVSQEGTNGFTIGDGKTIFPMQEFGYRPAESIARAEHLPNAQEMTAGDFLTEDGIELYKFLTKNPDQFFYKNLASGMLADLKNTPEFRLLFDHLLPVKKYMVLSFIYANEALSRFIPEPTDILDLTKDSIKSVFENLVSSADYKHLPTKVSKMMEDRILRAQGGTTGKEPDMTAQILEIIYRTPLIILKGFVEITDPAVMIAKTIIDVAVAVKQATVSAMEQALNTAKQIADGAISAAESAVNQIKATAGIDLAQAKTFEKILKASPTVPEELKNSINLDTEGKDIDAWVLDAPATIDQYLDVGPVPMTDIDKINWTNLKEKFDNLKSLQSDIAEAISKLEAAKAEKAEIEQKIKDVLEPAKEAMKDVFDSPYLLPAMWFALLPSMTPYFGGVIPPPFPGGPPSTVPGMIYIALLFIDAIEEKVHDDLQKPNCDDEL